MIKIIEAIAEKANEMYWEIISDIEFNRKDPNYFGKVSDEIADDLYEFLSELTYNESLTEEWTSESNLKKHFNKHCIGTNKKQSNKSEILYDFTNIKDYEKYENKINNIALHSQCVITSLFNTTKVLSALKNISSKPISILFDTTCKFKNANGSVKIGLVSFADSVTKNYGSAHTVNIIIISKGDNTITMYPVDANKIENKLKNIVQKYNRNRKIRKLYK